MQQEAEQKVAYEGYQLANQKAQAEAIKTGQPQTLTNDKIEAAKQEVLDTKYLVSRGPQLAPDVAPTKTYAIPVRDEQAEAAALKKNYADFQKQNLQLQGQQLKQAKQSQNAQRYQQQKAQVQSVANVENLNVSRGILGPELLSFVQSQEAGGKVRYNGKLAVDKKTGDVTFFFTDVAASKEYEKNLQASRRINYENKQAEQKFRDDASKNGLVVTKTQNADGSYTLTASKPNIPFNPNLAEQLYRGTVGYGGEAVSGVLDLLALGSANKKPLQDLSEKVKDATSLKTLGNFYQAIGDATGIRSYKEYAAHAKEQAQVEEPVEGPISATIGGLAGIAGSQEGKNTINRFNEQIEKRPIETVITTALDIIPFASASKVVKPVSEVVGNIGGKVSTGIKSGIKSIKIPRAYAATEEATKFPEVNLTGERLTSDLNPKVEVNTSGNRLNADLNSEKTINLTGERISEPTTALHYERDDLRNFADFKKDEISYQRDVSIARQLGDVEKAEEFKNPLESNFAPQEPKTKGGGTFKEFKPFSSVDVGNGGAGTTGRYKTLTSEEAIDQQTKYLRDLEQAKKKANQELSKSSIINASVEETPVKSLETGTSTATTSTTQTSNATGPLGIGDSSKVVNARKLKSKSPQLDFEEQTIHVSNMSGPARAKALNALKAQGRQEQGKQAAIDLGQRQQVLQNLQYISNKAKVKPVQFQGATPGALLQPPSTGQGFRQPSQPRLTGIPRSGNIPRPELIPRSIGLIPTTFQIPTPRTVTKPKADIRTVPTPKFNPYTIPYVKVPIPKIDPNFGGFGIPKGSKKREGTEISDLSVANIAFPSLSIDTGKGEQSKAARKLLKGGKKKKKGNDSIFDF